MTTDPVRSLIGQIAANERWSRPAAKEARRSPMRVKFERDARAEDPGASDDEIAWRVEHKMRAHMARMLLAARRAAAERRGEELDEVAPPRLRLVGRDDAAVELSPPRVYRRG